MSFWGATVTSSKPFEESVPTNANLVVSHVSLAGPTDGVTTLMCTVEGTEGDFVVAHLSWGRNEQSSVDLVYPLGTDVKFTVKGKGEVHLLGMYDPIDSMGYDDSDEEGMMFGSEDSDLDGSDEEDSDEALRMQYGTGRGPKITELPEGEDDEDDEDSDEDEGVAVPVQQPKKQQQGQQQKQGGQQQKQGGQQGGQKQGGQQQKQGGQQQKQGGQQGGQKQGGQQQGGQQQGQKRKIPIQDVSNQPNKKQKTAAKELTATNNKKDDKDKSNIINLKCQPCDQMFASKASLDQHKRAKHPKRK